MVALFTFTISFRRISARALADVRVWRVATGDFVILETAALDFVDWNEKFAEKETFFSMK